MAYLQKSDYTLRIDIVTLEEILTQAALTSGLTNDQVRTNAELWAQSVITSYLASRYQIGQEFSRSAPDASRNFLIIGVMLDLAIWTMHKTVNPRDIPELRQLSYEESMSWLEKARDAEFVITGVATISTYYPTVIGSGVKFVSDPFKEARFRDYPDNSPIPI